MMTLKLISTTQTALFVIIGIIGIHSTPNMTCPFTRGDYSKEKS